MADELCDFEPVRTWLLLRDGEFFANFFTKKAADDAIAMYRPGSKHKWSLHKGVIVLGEHR